MLDSKKKEKKTYILWENTQQLVHPLNPTFQAIFKLQTLDLNLQVL